MLARHGTDGQLSCCICVGWGSSSDTNIGHGTGALEATALLALILVITAGLGGLPLPFWPSAAFTLAAAHATISARIAFASWWVSAVTIQPGTYSVLAARALAENSEVAWRQLFLVAERRCSVSF